LGIGPNPQSPIPNPQSPYDFVNIIFIKLSKYINIKILSKSKLKYSIFHKNENQSNIHYFLIFISFPN
jgi:hypothetical protein